MNKFSYGKKCPYCKEIKRKRIAGLFWMKPLLFTKYYFCGWCGATYFSIFRLVSVRISWPKGRNLIKGLCINLPFQFSRYISNKAGVIKDRQNLWYHQSQLLRLSFSSAITPNLLNLLDIITISQPRFQLKRFMPHTTYCTRIL